MMNFQSIKHDHKDGSGLTAGQIHRLWQQVFLDRFTYGIGGLEHPQAAPYEPPKFSRSQLQFLAGAAEHMAMICYDAGYHYAKKETSK